MKPTDYSQYSACIDFFSQNKIAPDIHYFIDIVIQLLASNAKLADVGSGTGYISAKIKSKRNDIKFTLIEPSTQMYNLTQQRFGHSIELLKQPIELIIDSLPQQNAFMFCRSLYAYSGVRQDYQALFQRLFQILPTLGQLFIFEPESLYNIEHYKKNVSNCLDENKEEYAFFLDNWPIMKRALQRFNQGIENEEFTLFKQSALDDLIQTVGFEKTICINPNIWCYRKPYDCKL